MSKQDNDYEFTVVSTTIEHSDVVVDGYDCIDNDEPPTTQIIAEPVHEILENEDQHEKKLIQAASIGSAILGCLVGGPFIAIVLGLGAKYVCEQAPTGNDETNDNNNGTSSSSSIPSNSSCLYDTVRAIGEITLSIHEKALQLDQKHAIVNESQRILSNLWNRTKEFDQRHRILVRTKESIVTGFNATAEYVERHNLVERAIHNVGLGMVWLTEKLTIILTSSSSSSRENESDHETQRLRLLRKDHHEHNLME